ncbi:MAG: NUDIX hydrolase [Lachnospiraceae bacterium]|nr:NUDIX hydrolase [Lachnospiraceae bacterium]MCI8826805.1 NUDIX hydrolase [Lachnospiraceae bacterium]MCI9369765.1 NUDIX hydrolase [Lachnospiraceae bacterium]
MNNDNTNWGQSVTGVVIHKGKVLLARHTYGTGVGKLIIPGGYVQYNETPQDALIREYLEETGIKVEPENIIGIRFNIHDWYIAFRAKYISGIPRSDNDENSEVIWIEIEEALKREDVPDLSKKLIQSAVLNKEGLRYTEYNSNSLTPFSLYC